MNSSNILANQNTWTIYTQTALDAHFRQAMKKEFVSNLNSMVTNCILDLEGVRLVNNSGIVLLIELKKMCLEKGINLQLANASEEVTLKVKEMGLDNILSAE